MSLSCCIASTLELPPLPPRPPLPMSDRITFVKIHCHAPALREVEGGEQAARAQLRVVAREHLDEVAALPAAQLELEALPLRVLEDVAEFGLGDGRKPAQL